MRLQPYSLTADFVFAMFAPYLVANFRLRFQKPTTSPARQTFDTLHTRPLPNSEHRPQISTIVFELAHLSGHAQGRLNRL